ncbi:MAG: hypothetical protein WAZ77_10090 [Candidatus Nitrosopolaris sp.]
MAATGSTYYILDARTEIFQIRCMVSWHCNILVFCFKEDSAAFWLTDNIYTLLGHSFIASSPSLPITIRNFVGSIIAAGVVVTSQNVFYKIGAQRS